MARRARPQHTASIVSQAADGAATPRSTSLSRRRLSQALLAACLAATLGGCSNVTKNLFDYINPANSFLDPSQVGRFDRSNPWGDVRPVKWPILEQLDVIDEPQEKFANATDPTAADLIADKKEYIVGAGDVLRITVWELVSPGSEYVRESAQVSEAGTISIQNLGAVQVAGLTPPLIEEKIGQLAVERNLLLPKGNGSQGPQVTVSLLQSRSRVFSILGAVGATGTYNIIGNDFRVLDALALARDVAGGTQPGMDYLYIIRKDAPRPDVSQPTAPSAPAADGTSPATPPAGNPLDALDSLDKATTAPAGAQTAPATGPATTGPTYVRPLPTTGQVPQSDLDAALSGGPTPSASQPATGGATTAPSTDLLNQAMGMANGKEGQNVFIDGKWVTLPSTRPATPPAAAPAVASTPAVPVPPPAVPSPAPAPAPETMTPGLAMAAADQMSGQRVIRIPLAALREGNPKYNIVIRPGDVLNVPQVDTGLFYMMGHVNRPGVYSINGQKITLKMAVATAGNLDSLAIPRRCELIRRIGPNQEVNVQVNLQAIFDGTQPDIFLKSNDLINVGTDILAPFLAVTRNAYRASYGFGFIYDRNFYNAPVINQTR